VAAEAISGTTRSGAGPSDAALALAARAGETWAKEALFRRYAPMVNRLAFRLLGSDSDLDDLVQESFAEALSSLGRLRNTETFPAWLSAIVVRTANKLLRRRRLMTQLGLRRSQPVDFNALQARVIPQDIAVELRVLYNLVENMPPKLRIPLLLRHLEEASLEEIARLTGCSLATVKRRLAAAQARLDDALVQEQGRQHAKR
jgi:RNA polymerase sigma-70 factor (ECF subfamily)